MFTSRVFNSLVSKSFSLITSRNYVRESNKEAAERILDATAIGVSVVFVSIVVDYAHEKLISFAGADRFKHLCPFYSPDDTDI